MTVSFSSQVLEPGACNGEVLVLDEPLSFWGGYDAQTGCIIDRHHPQVGECATGRILVVPESRGSAATPGGIALAMHLATAPVAIVLAKADVNIVVGAMIGSILYGTNLPTFVLQPECFKQLAMGDQLSISAEGIITVLSR